MAHRLTKPSELRPFSSEEIRRFRNEINGVMLQRFLITLEEKESELRQREQEIAELKKRLGRARPEGHSR